MASLAVSLPLSLDSGDGFLMIKDYKTLIKQNLKSLVLTNPGERVMEPLYGVGIKQFLFANPHEGFHLKIADKINEQVGQFLPSIIIVDILFPAISSDTNSMAIKLVYSIPAINSTDLLQFTI
jgi:phage baseplate assembly protein W